MKKSLPIFSSLVFWTLIAGLVAFVVKFFWPAFPFTNTEILSLILFVLGLFKVIPSFRARVAFGSIFWSLDFWKMVVGLISFVILYFVPTFPFDATVILTAVLFILGLFDITPELRLRKKII